MSDSTRSTNRLAHETSPYLRQHAHNPVDWYPWGPEALERARTLDRPIFLSIGYSACHWCHVMERESFEDEEVARLLNDNFVSIKVDREERPDLDAIYMAAIQMLNNGQGGWPMSVFLTPQLQPFTGGTYFPPEDRYGRPGFKRVLRTVADWWRNRRADVEQAAGQITDVLQRSGRPEAREGALDESLLRGAASTLAALYDPQFGGFGRAPKFPHPMDLRLLLRLWQRFGDDSALQMARHTLERMAMGGIYDHLGGGFARYSTDARWLVPHFEKMLYDNALLVPCYLELWQITRDDFHAEVARDTLDWVLREMASPEGPFYSTLDADSEGVEGKFYVWSEAEIEQLLGKEDAALFSAVYGVEPGGNWEGHNILHRSKTWAQMARLFGIDEARLRETLARARGVLFRAREQRVRPGRDDKMLTSWNGLMIGAMALAGAVLQEPRYRDAAVKAADFLLTRLRTPDGRLLHSYSSGSEPRLNGYLEDYSFLIDALMTLWETTFEPRWLRAALELTGVLLDQFSDPDSAGFFFTGRDHEPLIARTKDIQDNATPSGNAMAVTALLRLALLTDRHDLRDRAEATLRLHRGLMAEHPTATGQMLLALDFRLGPVEEWAIVGDPSAAETRRVVRALYRTFLPRRVLALKRPGEPDLDSLVPLLANKVSTGPVTAYRCRNFACAAPLVGPEAVEAALQSPVPPA
jgi:uncharacterized protein YyaL (SSP411 family)